MATDFLDFIAHADKPVLADFWAEWCGPCKIMGPVIKSLAQEWKGKVSIVKVNTEERPALASRYSITSIPTLILFIGGKEIHRVAGALPIGSIKKEFERFL